MNGKPGRKPIANRADVRTTHVTIKMSTVERDALLALVEQRRNERETAGIQGVFTVSAYVRELVAKDARRRGVAKKRDDC
jgi:hypothetical protein